MAAPKQRGVRFVYDGKGGRLKIGQMIGRLRNKRPALEIIANVLLLAARRSFKFQQSPQGRPWKALDLRYQFRKQQKVGLRPILQFSGTMLRSLHVGVQGDRAFVSTSLLPYARIHQQGGRAGRNRSAKIPARPFLGLGRRDEQDIADDLSALIVDGRLA